MTTQEVQTQTVQESEKQALNKRLESISWALFLIMLGCLGFIPPTQVTPGIWSIGVGVIMLGLNAARYANGIKMSGFTVVLGLLAVITGVAEVFGVDLPVFPILLVIIGANIILKPWFEKHDLFEKQEEEAKPQSGTNVSQLVWGIICLCIGILLAVLTFVLPPDEMMFMVGDANLPIIPAAILGVLGIVLVATSFKR